MKKMVLFLMSLTSGALALGATSQLSIDTAKNLSKFMKPAIESKDAPATCWFLGQVHGYSLALRNSGDKDGDKLFNLVKDSANKCGGKNGPNTAETFTSEEWKHLSDLQKKIEYFKN